MSTAATATVTATVAPPPAPVPADTGAGAAALRITLFGPMRVLVRGEPLPPVRSRKILWLLALLALRAGRAVEREWLAGTLWPDVDQARAFDNLRPALSRLRDALGPEAGRLHTPSRGTLLLDLSGAGADADVAAFDAAIGRGDPGSLAAAVALYAGPLLEGVAEEWVVQDREAREQDCLRALHRLGEWAAGAGDHGAAAGHWRRAAAMDPLSEAARRGLMAALAASGDTNAALAVYREFAAALRASDPRAAPDQETESLYRRLRDDARRRAGATATAGGGQDGAASSPAWAPAPRVSGHLPHAPTGLIGREDESQEVAAALRRARLVTLTGPGGIGKTRLALATADEVVGEFPDGVQLVALESLRPAGPEGDQGAEAEQAVTRQVAAAFGVREEAGRPDLDALAERLRRSKLLLVLDNCEHVLEACARLASRLLRECPGLRILATSREALRVGGETIWVVPALTTPDPDRLPERSGGAALSRLLGGYDAVRLFAERATAAHRGFAVTGENARDVARLCSRLEGVPLAIELAAARAGVLSPAQTLAQLDARPLDALSSRQRDAAPRQRSLRSVLEWSVALLPQDARGFLADMGVFRGGWTLEAAQAVSPDHDALEMLSVLRDASLVNVADAGQGTRFSLLETVRQFAAEMLEGSGRVQQVRARHRDWYLSLAEEAETGLNGPEQAGWSRRLDTENDNLRAALAWCEAEAEATQGARGASEGLRLAGALVTFWRRRGAINEGRDYLRRALQREGARAATPERAKALNGAASMAQDQGDFASAEALNEEALGIHRGSRDNAGIASSLDSLGVTAYAQGDLEAARALWQEALEFSRESGHKAGIAPSLLHLGICSYTQGYREAARALTQESLAVSREMGDEAGIAGSLRHLGIWARRQGDLDTARTLLQESLAVSREMGERGGIVTTLYHLGGSAIAQGDHDAARTLLQEALTIARGTGWHYAIHITGLLGHVERDAGEYDRAGAYYRESLLRRQEKGGVVDIGCSLEDLAALAGRQGHCGRAARLLGAAEALCATIGRTPPVAIAHEYERAAAAARAALGEEAFAAAWAQGRAMTLERAVAYALEEEDAVPAAAP